MAIMTQDTTTPEADREVMSLLDEALAKAMSDYRAQAVLDNFGEVDVPDGSDARCCVCMHPLAGLTGYYDKRDSHPRPLLCVDDYEIETKAAKGTLR